MFHPAVKTEPNIKALIQICLRTKKRNFQINKTYSSITISSKPKPSCHKLLCKATERTFISRLSKNTELQCVILSQQNSICPPSSAAPQSADFQSLWGAQLVGLVSEYVVTLCFRDTGAHE